MKKSMKIAGVFGILVGLSFLTRGLFEGDPVLWRLDMILGTVILYGNSFSLWSKP